MSRLIAHLLSRRLSRFLATTLTLFGAGRVCCCPDDVHARAGRHPDSPGAPVPGYTPGGIGPGGIKSRRPGRAISRCTGSAPAAFDCRPGRTPVLIATIRP